MGYAQKHHVKSAPAVTKLKLFVGSTSIFVVVDVKNLNAGPETPGVSDGFIVPLIAKLVATMLETPETNTSFLSVSKL
jgi:hypothetical protein